MKNALTALINLSEEEKEKVGIKYTASEIYGQVDLWENTLDRVNGLSDRLHPFLKEFQDRGKGCIVCTGAGTSEFIGYCIEGLLRKNLGTPVNVFSTTKIVTTPSDVFFPGYPFLLISFARSGNSPESIGAVKIADMTTPKVSHLIITCNILGLLYKWGKEREAALTLCLDEKTNDRGLAMTSSFSNMVIAGQALSHSYNSKMYFSTLERLIRAGKNILESAPDTVKEICSLDFHRAVFLGNGSNFGTAVESHLKLQELTSGTVMCAYDTFLGLRHGPESVIDPQTLVTAYISNDQYLRKYEVDLLREIREKKIGLSVLTCGGSIDREIRDLSDYVIEYDPNHSLDIADDLTPPVLVTVGQLLGLFKSLQLGFKPDSPSDQGVIHRVVKGVKVYNPEAYAQSGKFDIVSER
jgi:tagatose-6-phosphate ketose/aldose isomerase